MTAEHQFGPWIAWNATPISTCPPDAVGKRGQAQLASQTRIEASRRKPDELNSFRWDHFNDFDIIAYRVLIEPVQPVRGEKTWFYDDDVWYNENIDDPTHTLRLPTIDGALIPGTYTGPYGAVIKVKAV